MSVFQLLESKLRKELVYSRDRGRAFRVSSVEALTARTQPESHRIYITDEVTCGSFLQKKKESIKGMPLLFLVSGKPSKNKLLKELAERYDLSMIVAEQSELQLGIAAAQAMNYYLSLDQFVSSQTANRDLISICRQLSEWVGEEVLLINSFGNILFESNRISGIMRKEMVAQYHDILNGVQETNLHEDSGEDSPYLYVRLQQGETVYGVLFISLRNQVPHDYERLLHRMVSIMNQVIFAGDRTNPTVPPKFSLIWKDIMEGKYSSSEELKKRFVHAGYKTNKFYRLMVLQLNQPVEQMEYLFLQMYPALKQVYPDSLLTLYLGTIVILNWEEDRSYRQDQDSPPVAALEEMLREYDGWMCVGWNGRNLTWLEPLYRFYHKVLNMRSQIVEGRRESRVLSYGDYCSFLVVDQCAQHLRSAKDVRDMMLLAHPAVINLYRYDRNHNTDLETLFYTYLINHRSLEQTAAGMYMHRNTVVNKIRKIRSMIDADLDDPQIQAHLILSHFLLMYCVNIIDPNFVTEQTTE